MYQFGGVVSFVQRVVLGRPKVEAMRLWGFEELETAGSSNNELCWAVASVAGQLPKVFRLQLSSWAGNL